jgi:hypothetical protein
VNAPFAPAMLKVDKLTLSRSAALSNVANAGPEEDASNETPACLTPLPLKTLT